MNDDTKVLIKNITKFDVGFNCPNHTQVFNFYPGQTIPVKWEYLYDAAFGRGFRQLIEKAYLKILPTNENYEEIMDELQFSHLLEKIEKSLSYEDAKNIFSIIPLSTQYGKIKEFLKDGNEATKQNIVNAALDLKIKDYIINDAIKKATDIDVLKTLMLQENPKDDPLE